MVTLTLGAGPFRAAELLFPDDLTSVVLENLIVAEQPGAMLEPRETADRQVFGQRQLVERPGDAERGLGQNRQWLGLGARRRCAGIGGETTAASGTTSGEILAAPGRPAQELVEIEAKTSIPSPSVFACRLMRCTRLDSALTIFRLTSVKFTRSRPSQ
jgi:hypothetical protein